MLLALAVWFCTLPLLGLVLLLRLALPTATLAILIVHAALLLVCRRMCCRPVHPPPTVRARFVLTHPSLIVGGRWPARAIWR